MLGAAQGQSPALNGGAGIQELSCPPEEDIGRREIVQRLMIPVVIVVFDECRNRLLQLPGKVMMLQADHILHGPVVALDFALGLRVVGCATGVLEAVFGQIGGCTSSDQLGHAKRCILVDNIR